MKDAQSAALEVNPDAVIFLNGGGFSTCRTLLAGGPRRMEAYQNFTGAEQFYHTTTNYDAPYKSLNLARFLSAGEKPAVVFTHHCLSTWRYIPLPPAGCGR